MIPALVVARAPSIALFTTLEAGLAYFVYSQWKKPSMINGPLPTAIPQGYVGRARFEHHDLQPTHISQTVGFKTAHTH
ncbi:hypothetical protein C8Q80DRAFT_1264404 [Daedaleopsis nitida]|nr:hypothetical protein C8Q80DRAFT_1264404 [Daedaleopsis nitida]